MQQAPERRKPPALDHPAAGGFAMCPSWTHLFFSVDGGQLLLGVITAQHPVDHLAGRGPGVAVFIDIAVQQLGDVRGHGLFIFFLRVLLLEHLVLQKSHDIFLPCLGELIVAHDQVRLIWYC